MTSIEQRVSEQRDRILAAAERVGRSAAEVTLIAVSKMRTPAEIREASAAGLVDFGESYVPEWRSKRDDVDGVRWHFVGHLQSNKARVVAGEVACIHSVDRASLIHQLNRMDKSQDVMIQVNIAGDPAKSGCTPDELPAMLEVIGGSPILRAVGLMTIGPLVDDPESARPYFRKLRALRDQYVGDHPSLRALSMGMSADLEVAVEEGATHVRVGTAIFGPRARR